jgi:hypothetical protein
MSITYTYKITAVNEAARCMEVVYTTEGLTTYTIGTRLPFEGEQLESVIQAYAPIPQWIEESTPVVAPEVGVEGTIVPEEPAQPDLSNIEQPTVQGAQTL